MSPRAVAPVANYQCVLGENPLWNDRDGCIYWEDIDTGRLFRAAHDTLEHENFYTGDVVGGFTFQEDGTLLLFEANRIASLDPVSGRRRVLVENVDSDMQRFNDVTADPEGRVFAGTIGTTDTNGGLYRIDPDGSVRLLWKGTKIANGMGFTTDLARFFWTCTTSRTIFVCDYDRATGELSNRRPFYAAPEGEGDPDGMCVDAENTVYTTRWGGACVLRLSTAGTVAARIDIPVPNVTSVAFGGPHLDTLYITTAGGRGEGGGAEGTLYRVAAESRGQREYRSRVRL